MNYLFEKHKKSIAYNLFFSFLFVLPLLLANTPYEDDLHRDLYGGGLNIGHGRFIGSMLLSVFSFNQTYCFSWFPFSSIFTFALFGISGLLMSNLLHIEENKTLKLSSFIILCSPFLLHNLSYRYDINMSLSFFVLIIPFFFKQKFYFLTLSILAIYFSMALYQASTSSYLIISIIYYLSKKDKNKNFKILNFFFLSLLSFAIACILYKITLIVFNMPITYRGIETIFLKRDFFVLLKNNLVIYIDSLSPITSMKYLISISLFIILSLFGLIYYIIKNKNYILIIKLMISSILIFLLIDGVNLFITPTVTDPRTLIGYSLVLYVPAIFLNKIKYSNLKLISYSILLIYSFLVMSSYCIFLKNHEKYMASINNIIDSNFKNQNSNTKRIIIGHIIPTNNKIIYKSFPIIRRIQPSNWYNHIRLNSYYGYKRPSSKEMDKFNNKNEQIKFDIKWENQNLTIRGNDSLILIISKN